MPGAGEPDTAAAGSAVEVQKSPDRKSDSRLRHNTPRRQATNKSAQQRYRARKKACDDDLMAKAVTLDATLRELEQARAGIQDFKLENAKLQAQLQLPQLQSTTAAAGHNSVQRATQPYGAVQAKLVAAHKDLEAVLCDARLPSDSATAKPVGRELALKLGPALERARVLHGQAAFVLVFQQDSADTMRMHPAPPFDTSLGEQMLQLPSHVGGAERASARNTRLRSAMLSLHLSGEQQAQLLHARSRVLQQLPAIYETRTHLATAAIAALCVPAPATSVQPSAVASTVASKIGVARAIGIAPMQVSAYKAIKAMSRVRDNVQEEFMVLLQLHNLILKEVLTPVQAAVLHVQAGHSPLDALSFCNAVAAEFSTRAEPRGGALNARAGRAADSCEVAAQSAHSHEARELALRHLCQALLTD